MFFGRPAPRTAFFPLASAAVIATFTLVSACGKSTSIASKPSTVDIAHTDSKWQSIGNCWIYSFASWAESLVLQSSAGNTLNLSESYLTYRHYQVQLSGRTTAPQEVQTGGFWTLARDLTLRYGFMEEGDFAPDESDKTFSARQKAATAYLNASLKNGKLKNDLTAATVKAELNAAFGVDIDTLAPKIKPASSLLVSKPGASVTQNFESEMRSWRGADWPSDWANMPSSSEALPSYAGQPTAAQEALLRRVKRALNDHQPVVLDWFVDFNALTNEGVFSAAELKRRGSGRQGFHSVVVEDYLVEGVDPATGEKFVVGEGETSRELKALAAEYGTITSFIIKNSWGGLERLDRKSYVRGGVGGFHKLNADYLFGWLARNDETTGEFIGPQSGLTRFTLPAGY